MRRTLMLVPIACAAIALGASPAMRSAAAWTATLTPKANTNINGMASAISGTASTTATVTISGATAGDVHPWHIHAGKCGDNGPVVGAARAYPPLTVGSDGSARATARIDVALTDGSPYYVNVHRSRSDMGTIVSCGDLTPAGM